MKNMEKEKIIETLNKETVNREDLLKKKREIELKISKCDKNIENLNGMLNQKKFSEVTDVLSASGLSVEELMEALKGGDLLSLQDKLEHKNSTDK